MSMDNGDTTPTQPYQAPQPPTPPHKSHKPLIAMAIAGAAVLGLGGFGTAGYALLTLPSTLAAASQKTSPSQSPYSNREQYQQQVIPGTTPGDGSGYGDGSFGGGTSTQQQPSASTAAEQVGVVTINTVLNYDTSEQAAGTGMIIGSDGLILTNNHVVEGATSINVTVESTGKTYIARVVGTDQKEDVAVLQLANASGLSTVKFAPNETVSAGDAIYSVGNAGGTGDLVTTVGTVGATNQSLAIQGDGTTKAENLTGLIELDSDVVSGDSGGPLFDRNGDVIGIVTAASSGSADVSGYAINIAQVLAIADKIEAGTKTADIVIGPPAFLGVELAEATDPSDPTNPATGGAATGSGVAIAGTIDGLPAANAGITAGSLITAVNGTKVTTSTELSAAIAAHSVGDRVTISWTSATGAHHTSTVTLLGGPAA